MCKFAVLLQLNYKSFHVKVSFQKKNKIHLYFVAHLAYNMWFVAGSFYIWYAKI